MAPGRDVQLQLALEHAAVRNAISDLRQELSRIESNPAPEQPVAKLSGMLRMFRHHLQRHFQLEERGGYLNGSLGPDPETQRVLDQLLAQHRDLESRLTTLLAEVECAEEGRASLEGTFAAQLRAVLAEIEQHDSSENELVQKLVIQDVTAGD